MTDNEHVELFELLDSCQGKVIVSGYESEMYRDLYKGWDVRQRDTHADGVRDRTEMLWMKNTNENSLF